VDFASWPRERPGAAPIAWLGPALSPELPVLCAEAVRRFDLQAAGDPAGDDRPLEDEARKDRLAPASALTSPASALALTVDGTDVPLSCRLNTPRRAGRSTSGRPPAG